jgi:hypothetical protein
MSTTDIHDYIAAGYFLSRYVGPHDCTGIELRRLTLANDHSPREFFPDGWCLSWCHSSRQEMVAAASVFGIPESELAGVISWADKHFGLEFGAWSVFFELRGAREVARSVLGNAADLDLWGVGLHRSVVGEYRAATTAATRPGAPRAGFAQVGAGGVRDAICSFGEALACCHHLDLKAGVTQHKITGWLPWLVVRYSVGG